MHLDSAPKKAFSVLYLWCGILADRAKTRFGGDADELGRQNLHDGVAVTLTGDLATSPLRIVILVDPADPPDKIAQVEAFQAATAAIRSVNPTIFSTRRRL